MTQLEHAKEGRVTKEMRAVAAEERIPVAKLCREMACGRTVIPANKLHKRLHPIGIGCGLRTKVNANLGSSPLCKNLNLELEKLRAAIDAGADAVMDLSIGGDTGVFRKTVLKNSAVPVGTVPVYQAIQEKNFLDLQEKDFIKAIKKHVTDAVDFITVHAGLTKKCLPLIKKRKIPVVSRGGSFIARWMQHNCEENPFYSAFDEILEIAFQHDCTLSLGDGLRPGCVADATDAAQIAELKELGKLQKQAFKANVQSMIEGPGHIPLNQIKKNVELEKKYCNGAPFYVLGPIVTDIAPGYDHLTAAIGGALAAFHGADFLCYVTPAEHLRLPSIEDVREGVFAARIAAHAADVAKGVKNASAWDDEMSDARKKLDWKKMIALAIDSEKASRYRRESGAKGKQCTMCGHYCVLK
jgi:phosphomethylpyrimidine synthase